MLCSSLVKPILWAWRHAFDPFGWLSLSKAGLVGLEVLLCFLQWAALWHLDSGLVKVGFRLLYWHFFSSPCFCIISSAVSASFLLHHFHILRLVSSPWRVGLIAAAATCSAWQWPGPGPNTGWLSQTLFDIFRQVEINESWQDDNAIWNEGIGQCITWGNACWRKLGAFRLSAFTVYILVNATLWQCLNLALSRGFTSSLSSFFLLEITNYQSTH